MSALHSWQVWKLHQRLQSGAPLQKCRSKDHVVIYSCVCVLLLSQWVVRACINHLGFRTLKRCSATWRDPLRKGPFLELQWSRRGVLNCRVQPGWPWQVGQNCSSHFFNLFLKNDLGWSSWSWAVALVISCARFTHNATKDFTEKKCNMSNSSRCELFRGKVLWLSLNWLWNQRCKRGKQIYEWSISKVTLNIFCIYF